MPRSSIAFHRMLLRAALVAAASQVACGGGGGDQCPISDPNCNATNGGNPSVVSVTVTGAPATMQPGQIAQVTAAVSVVNNASKGVAWSSSNTNVVSISGSGASVSITAVGAGQATITATSQADASKHGDATITVAGVTGVTISPSPAQVTVGGTANLSATVASFGGASADVTWTSSNTAVATIASSGVGTGIVRGVAAGTATITATSVADNKRTASVAVTVTANQAISRWTPTHLPYINGPTGIVTGLWGTSPTNMFSGTEDGDIARYDGTSWTISQQNAGTIEFMHGTATNDVWAVTYEGQIWHFNGSSWSSTTSPVTTGLLSVFAVSTTAAFAVGTGGTVLRYNGSSWSQITGVPSTATLYGVWASSPTDLYVAGAGGVVYRWNGTIWTTLTTGLAATDTLLAISGSSAANIIAVGRHSVAIRWNGSSFSKISPSTSTSANIWDIHVLSTSEAYAVTDAYLPNTVLQFNGTTWSNLNGGYTLACYSVFSFGSAAGTFGGCQIGVTFVVRSGAFTTISLTPGYNGVSVNASGAGTAVGDFSSVLRLSGSSWVPVFRRDFGYYEAVWMEPSANNAFLVGTQGIDRLAAGATTPNNQLPAPTGKIFRGVWGVSATNVFAVGDSGMIYHYDGASWTPMTSGTTNQLWSISGSGANNVWAVGANGTILHYNGTSWSSSASGTSQYVVGVWSPDVNNAVVVGTNGTILRYTGTSWSPMTSGSQQTLYSVWGANVGDIYAVGTNGTILHYNGTAWSPMTSGTAFDFYSIAAVAGGVAVAVGEASTLELGAATIAPPAASMRMPHRLPRPTTAPGELRKGAPTKGSANPARY